LFFLRDVAEQCNVLLVESLMNLDTQKPKETTSPKYSDSLKDKDEGESFLA
jgi:hypothetical protein